LIPQWGPDLFCYGLSVADYGSDINNLPPKLLRVVEAVRKRSGAVVRSVRLDEWNNENGLRYPWDYARLWWHTRRMKSISFKILAFDLDYWGRGLDALMYVELAKATLRKGCTWMDMSLTGEDNPQTNKLATLVGARVYKRYRIFELAL
jgi:hypothetical protein